MVAPCDGGRPIADASVFRTTIFTDERHRQSSATGASTDRAES